MLTGLHTLSTTNCDVEWHSKAAFLEYTRTDTAKCLTEFFTDIAPGCVERSVGEHSHGISSYNTTIGRNQDPPWGGFTELTTVYFTSTMSKDEKDKFEQDLETIRLRLRLDGDAAGLRKGGGKQGYYTSYHLFWLPGFRFRGDQKCIAARLWLSWESHKCNVADQQSAILACMDGKQLEELGFVGSDTFHCDFEREGSRARY